ncbi:hypothetical protein G7Z17_g681 [Cylindrodendrum hubeiense]|uniref:Uncharacterized protein n=1 Tax=Cylindrodendrum hubeiense TaxID=595255 RepID=A0A9P5HKY6_9HYPO|nr:hypothetical protein G7Z17_g681 [Cylindrodendrum hubeiense]
MHSAHLFISPLALFGVAAAVNCPGVLDNDTCCVGGQLTLSNCPGWPICTGPTSFDPATTTLTCATQIATSVDDYSEVVASASSKYLDSNGNIIATATDEPDSSSTASDTAQSTATDTAQSTTSDTAEATSSDTEEATSSETGEATSDTAETTASDTTLATSGTTQAPSGATAEGSDDSATSTSDNGAAKAAATMLAPVGILALAALYFE